MPRTNILDEYPNLTLLSSNYIGKYGVISSTHFFNYYLLKYDLYRNQVMNLENQQDANDLNKIVMLLLKKHFPQSYEHLMDVYGYFEGDKKTFNNYRLYHTLLEKKPHQILHSFYPHQRNIAYHEKIFPTNFDKFNYTPSGLEIGFILERSRKLTYVQKAQKFQYLSNFEDNGIFKITNKNSLGRYELGNYLLDNIFEIKECLLDEIHHYETNKNPSIMGIVKCSLLIPSSKSYTNLVGKGFDMVQYFEAVYYNILIFLELLYLHNENKNDHNMTISEILDIIAIETFLDEKEVIVIEGACKTFFQDERMKLFNIRSKKQGTNRTLAQEMNNNNNDFDLNEAIGADREITIADSEEADNKKDHKIMEKIIVRKLKKLGIENGFDKYIFLFNEFLRTNDEDLEAIKETWGNIIDKISSIIDLDSLLDIFRYISDLDNFSAAVKEYYEEFIEELKERFSDIITEYVEDEDIKGLLIELKKNNKMKIYEEFIADKISYIDEQFIINKRKVNYSLYELYMLEECMEGLS